jgi:Zinc carboxypeptidase
MKIKMSFKYIISLIVLVLCIGTLNVYANTFTFRPNKVTVPLRFDHYYNYQMVVDALNKLHRFYPNLTRLEVVGKSEEGRAIYCMTINNPKTGKALDKPGIYVDGNIHGNEIQATEVALYLLDYLLGNYGKNDEITQLVDKKCFYVIPSVNVDGRHHFFEDANSYNSSRSLRRPKDDDRDGLLDEDFPDDLDGDGNICRMRIRDPYGRFKTDPNDPRLMIPVKPGKKGEWTMLGLEGIDNDGDGRLNEDPEGYVDPNRNWGFNWMPNYVQSGSGDYPFSGVGLKAIAQFVMKRPNICMAWAFHNFGGMFLRGPSTKSQPEFHPKDIQVYDYLGYQAERITPGYRYMISWKDLYPTYGDFTEWITRMFGCYAYVGELYTTAKEAFKTPDENIEKKESSEEGFFGDGGASQLERLKFNDHLTQQEFYKPWKPFKHPTYGDIEIGGWIKFSSRLPAAFLLKDLVHRNASAVIFSAKNTPEVSMEILQKKKIGKNLYRLRLRLSNSKIMPSMSYHAQKEKIYPKDMLTVSGQSIKVVAGGVLKNVYRNEVNYKEYRPELQFLAVPGLGKIDYQFLVSGTGSATIHYNSRHAGKISKTIKLKN